jgi:predicted AAA+ superfamily ATPase
VLNTALMSVQSHVSFAEALQQPDLWGRLVESSVGAHLVNTAAGTDIRVLYWRESDTEVDFILQKGKSLTAIEVKSGRLGERSAALERFAELHKPQRTLLVGTEGIPLVEFLGKPAQSWVG